MASKAKTDKTPAKADDKQIKVDKWDGSALKNALDDATKKVLIEDMGYEESHRLMDGRLAICTLSVGFAMFALAWDYLHPFPQSRPVLIFCVTSYFFMMGVLTLYTTLKEKGCFLVALDKDKAGIDPPNVWTFVSQVKRYDDQYTLYATYVDAKTKAVRTANFTKSVAQFFDVDGNLCSDYFEVEVRKLHSGLSSEKKHK
ncbi:hypothetical protein LSH36_233g09094 [Paralvinella palmiformis]|uniref:Signal peptidase complex subunit 2 n=1 Tax=Paralvinella palmiformis TaxID=53620 RepID=A0AAD9N5G8_9ANNE|nr:hypothetical protein LSH36_233g09094 [Paralvinella palmiformis]